MDQPNFKNLSDAISSYLKSLEAIEVRRNIWDLSVRSRVLNSLASIKNSYELEGAVENNQDVKNMNFVRLSLVSRKTLIGKSHFNPLSQTSSYKIYDLTGAQLTFYQTYNGKIVVLYQSPFIKELVEKASPELLGEYEPDHLDLQIITDIVTDFFRKVTEWEEKAHIPIDFKREMESKSF